MHVIITIVIEAVSITLYERKHTNALIGSLFSVSILMVPTLVIVSITCLSSERSLIIIHQHKHVIITVA